MLPAVNGALDMFRDRIATERVLNSGVAALFIGFGMAFVLDLAIDASWIPEVFFGVFAVAFLALYRTEKAPPLPSGDLLHRFGWMLLLFVVTLAVLRVFVRIGDALG
jgi:hypothetical protein